MANEVKKFNTVAVTDIKNINTQTDANIKELNALEFTGVIPDAHTFIADNSSDTTDIGYVEFTSGITNTYDVYEFVFTNLNPESDNVNLTFQVNSEDDEGGDYDLSPMTTTFAGAHHKEDDAATSTPYYETGFDQAQGTGFTILATYLGNASDESGSGSMLLYAPSSTTYVKHFWSRVHVVTNNEYSRDNYASGYINTGDPADQPAITQIRFKMSHGNFDGLIEMYGLAKA